MATFNEVFNTPRDEILGAVKSGAMTPWDGRTALVKLLIANGVDSATANEQALTIMKDAGIDLSTLGSGMGPIPGQGGTMGPGPEASPATGMYRANLTPEQRFGLGEDDPFAAYLRQGELPGVGQNQFQSWLTRQYDPAYATFGAASYLNPKTTSPDWANYLGGMPGVQAQRQQAKGLFGQAAGLGMPGQEDFTQSLGAGGFQDFMRAVLGGTYAPPVAKNMLGNLGGLQAQYNAQTGMGATDQEGFLNYLKNYYRL